MKENLVYLNYYQVMSLALAIDEIRKNDPYFSDNTVENFESIVLNRTIKLSYLPIQIKICPNYVFLRSMIDYLVKFTEVDIFDKKVLKKHKVLVKEFNQNLNIDKLISDLNNESDKKL